MESENVFHPSRGVHRHPLVLPTDKCLVELVLDGVHEGVVSAATDSVEVVHVDGPDHEAAQSVLHDVVHLCLESRHCLSFLFTVNHIDGRFKGINSLSLSLSLDLSPWPYLLLSVKTLSSQYFSYHLFFASMFRLLCLKRQCCRKLVSFVYSSSKRS